MPQHDLELLIPRFARLKGAALAPAWNTFEEAGIEPGPDALLRFTQASDWLPPETSDTPPGPHELPVLAYAPLLGWLVVEQWESDHSLRVVGREGPLSIGVDAIDFYADLTFPDPMSLASGDKAFGVFVKALKRRKHVFVSAVAATIITNIIALVTSLFSMQVYDRVIPRHGFSTLIVLTAGAAFALILDFALRSARALMIEREAAHVDEEISEYFFARSQAIRLDVRPPTVGTMASQLRGIEQVRSLLSSTTLFVIADLPFALFFIVIITLLGGIVALVPLLTFPLSIGLALLFGRLIRGNTNKAQVSSFRKNGLLVESLDAAETIKATGAGWMMLGRWNALVGEIHQHEDPVKRVSAMATSIFASIQQISYIAMIAVGAVEVTRGNMTTGALVACGIIAGRVNGPLIAMLPGLIVQWGYAKSSLAALDSILALPTDDNAGPEGLRPDAVTGPIVCSNLKFAYQNRPATLDLQRFELRPGETVGIIGGIGSGKSTLLRLLAGLYRPSEGRVLLNGLDMTQIAPEIVRRHIGYIPQDSRLVNGTLRQNLLLGLPDPGDEAIRQAAEATGLMSMIATSPQGVYLPISEGGAGLSGGQRMLTALTRLLLSDAKLLLLDEPTANLDQGTEAQVLQAIGKKMTADSTLVLVTHKLQLLNIVQRVVVLQNGRIVLDGPTKDVLGKLQVRPANPTGDAPAKAAAAVN